MIVGKLKTMRFLIGPPFLGDMREVLDVRSLVVEKLLLGPIEVVSRAHENLRMEQEVVRVSNWEFLQEDIIHEVSDVFVKILIVDVCANGVVLNKRVHVFKHKLGSASDRCCD